MTKDAVTEDFALSVRVALRAVRRGEMTVGAVALPSLSLSAVDPSVPSPTELLHVAQELGLLSRELGLARRRVHPHA